MFFPYIRNKRRKIFFLAAAYLLIFHRSVSTTDHPSAGLIVQTVPVRETMVSEQPPQTEMPVIDADAPDGQGLRDPRAQELDKIVYPITTVTKFVGGQEERNRGSGFVVGNRFFTVNHNLTTAFPSLRVKSTVFIDGMSVPQPILADKVHDVAVFELPEKLCARHCNDKEVDFAPNLTVSKKVYWLRKFENEFTLKEARILSTVAFGDSKHKTDLGCKNNTVVLVDQPFIPGSSGSPIMDAETGKIIGVIQGSVDEGEKSKGYFKPINCVLAMLAERHPSRAIAGL